MIKCNTLLELVSKGTKGVDEFSKGVVGINGFGFVFRGLDSSLPYVRSTNSSKFCTLSSLRDFRKIKKTFPYFDFDEQKYEILLGSTLRRLIPNIQYGGIETLFDVWVFVKTPDGMQFPATFYYGPSGAALGGWKDFKDDNGKDIFPKEFETFINFNPFQFTREELRNLVQALENSLRKVPLSDYYGVFKHDTGNTLMGVSLGKPFYMELYGDPSKLDIQKIINALLLL
jgi:hypothetical protein